MDSVGKSTVLSWASRIPWDSFIGADKAKGGSSVFVDGTDVKIIKKFAEEDPVTLTELLNTDAEARKYPTALLKVLMTITDIRILQYALTLLEDFLVADAAGRTKYFTKPGAQATDGKQHVFVLPFLQLVGTSGSGARISSLDADPYILERAATIAAHLLATDSSDAVATSSLLAWVMTHVKLYGSAVTAQVKVTEVAVSALQILLRNDFLRRLYVEEHGVERLVHMVGTRNSQLVYEVAFCLWAVSLVGEYCPILEQTGAVTSVARLVRANMPLKVLRVSCSLLVNVARHPQCGDSVAEICETHVPSVVDSLLASDPRISDPELLDDLRWLSEAARGNKRKLTSLERYEKELTARVFEWTPVHTSEFWRENATGFEVGDFRLIKAVAALLEDPGTDDTTLSVALFDLGEFAVSHPSGRTVLNSLGVRPIVMSLLKRDEAEVKQQALLALSKMFLQQWQHVSGSGGSTPLAAAAVK